MGTAWWSTNVLAFTPAMDVGATRYTIFIRAAMTNGVNYRANGTITMRNAPGFTPNTLPLPVPSIDFATVTPTNAPWLLAETDPGIPAAIASAVAIAGTNAQDMADIALVLARDYALTNQITKLWSNDRFVDGLGNSYIVSNFWNMTFSDDFADSLGGVPDQASYAVEYGTYVSETHGPYDWWSFGNNETGFYVNRRSGVGTYSNWKATTNQYVLDVFTTGNGKAFISHTATTNLIGTFALEDSVTAGLATKVSTNDATYLATVSKANTALQSDAVANSNNWDTAFGWGNHAGLYRLITYVPAWSEVTDKPSVFTPDVHNQAWDSITNPPATYTPSAHTQSYTTITDSPWALETSLSNSNNWNAAYGWGNHAGLYRPIAYVPTWSEVTDKPSVFTPDVHNQAWDSITNPPATYTPSAHTQSYTTIDNPPWLTSETEPALSVHETNTTAHTALFSYRAPFTAYTDLTGSITLTNNLEAPISISGTGSISVAFSGLVAPYPLYFTASGFSSLTFPAGSYLVGGGMWQTNRVNHFIVWQYSTNLYVNPLMSTEL
jgi:hypothetical protein